jgi:hypothetical protein
MAQDSQDHIRMTGNEPLPQRDSFLLEGLILYPARCF